MVPKIRFTTHAFGARGCAHLHPSPGWRWARPPRAPSACASPARGEACAQRPPKSPLPPRARVGLPRCPSAQVCPSFHRQPYLLKPFDVSFVSIPPPVPRPNAGKAFFTSHPSLFPTYLSTARAPRPRTPRPHACTPLPSSLALRPRPPPRAGRRSRLARPTPPPRTPAAPPPPTTERRAPRPPLAPRPHTRVASPRQARRCVLTSTPRDMSQVQARPDATRRAKPWT